MFEEHWTDQYIRDISMVLDNDEFSQAQVRESVAKNLRYGSGYEDLDPETYRDLFDDRPCELYGVAGIGVYEALDYIFEIEETKGISLELLKQFILGLRNDLGENYLPTPDDYEEIYESGGIDED